MVHPHTLGCGKRVAQFEKRYVGVMGHNLHQEIAKGAELASARRTPALRRHKALATSYLTRQAGAGRGRDMQTTGGFPAAETFFDATPKPATKVERKRCGHGVILLNRMNHSHTRLGIPRFNVEAKCFNRPMQTERPLNTG